MIPFILAAIITGVAFADALHDPRKVRIGISLTVALTLVGFGGAIAILSRLSSNETPAAQAYALVAMLGVAVLSVMVLTVFLLANGVTMLRRERHRLANTLSLIVGLALTAYIALVVVAVVQQDQWLITWLLAVLPPVGYLSFTFTAVLLYSYIYQRIARRTITRSRAIIVLGSGLLGDAVPPLLAARLTTGYQAFTKLTTRHPEAKLVVSGGQGPGESVPEAQAMAADLYDRGLDHNAILLEAQSRTTEQNLRFSQQRLADQGITGPVTLVTSDYHAFRGALLMRRLGIAGQAVGAPTARYYRPSAMIREYVAIMREHVWLNAIMLAIASGALILLVLLTIFGAF